MKTIGVFLCVVTLASSGPVNSEESVFRSVIGNLVNCNSDLSLCLKEHALKAADRLGSARKLSIIEGITILNNNPKESKSLDTLSTDPELRKKQVTERLWKSTTDLLQSSELELSYAGPQDEADESRANAETAEEGRGKKKEAKKKLKLIIPLLILAKAKAVALIVLSLIVIAASIFKIALIAKIAFIIKLIALLKALLAKKHEHEEIPWQPQGWEPHVEHHSVPVEHGHGWESGWSRSRNEGNSMAYSGYGI